MITSNYLYEVEDGQFSYSFEAPLMYKIGDQITLYDYSKEQNEIILQQTIEVVNINHSSGIVECCGNT